MNRTRELQLWNEQDVIGAMLVNGDMTTAMLKDLHALDFTFKHHQAIYQAMENLQKFGKFDTSELLGGDRGKAVLHAMDCCLMTNIDVKCQWLLESSVRRYV